MEWVQVTEPAGFPLLLDEAKEHLKVTYNDEDFFIQLLIEAATNHAEAITRRALMPRTFAAYLDDFPSGAWIELPRPKLRSVSSITYYDVDNSSQTFSASKYTVDTSRQPGRVYLNSDETWPITYLRPQAVTINYSAGYETIGDIPGAIRVGMLLMIGHWFENRESVVVGPTGLRVNEVPQSANMLLDMYQVMTFY